MDYDFLALKQRGLIYNGRHLPYKPGLIEKAKYLRKNMTDAEKKLWKECLRNCKIRVLRQRPIDCYIVDFYIPKIKLVIEVDGMIHNEKDIKEYDKQRTLFLELYGLKVIRFTNDEVVNNLRKVCKKVHNYL